jgi:hypothetical protein
MELEGSLPRLYVPAIDTYPKPDKTNRYPQILLPLRSILILSSHISLGLQSVHTFLISQINNRQACNGKFLERQKESKPPG